MVTPLNPTLVHDALLGKELEQVGEDHIDFDVADVSRTGAARNLTKLVRCQHGSPLATLIRGTSARSSITALSLMTGKSERTAWAVVSAARVVAIRRALGRF
jgi:hypothetical protein